MEKFNSIIEAINQSKDISIGLYKNQNIPSKIFDIDITLNKTNSDLCFEFENIVELNNFLDYMSSYSISNIDKKSLENQALLNNVNINIPFHITIQ